MQFPIRPLVACTILALVSGCVADTATTPSGADTASAQVLAGTSGVDPNRGATSPSNPNIRYAGGDGSTLAMAIVIKGASGEMDGVQSEYDWVAMNLPGWKPSGQSLLQDGGRYFDQLVLRKAGATRNVFFDITAFFGKF